MNEMKEVYDDLIMISLAVPMLIGLLTLNAKLCFPMWGLTFGYLLFVRRILGWNDYDKRY